MARRADPTPGHQRLLGLTAVAALSAGTAFAFGRVFAGRLPTLLLVVCALASVAIAVLFERRGLLIATLASLAGLALAITWVVLPQTTWYGLPSIRTLRAVGRSLEFVGRQARVRVAPTPPLPPLMLAAVTAVWTASFSAHALAIRAGSPLLAALPAIALVGFADTVLEDGARPIYAITLLAAVLAVVFADGLRRVRQWGPVWSGSRSRRLAPAVKGSRSVAAVVVVAAVLVPGVLPGFRSDPIVDLSTSGEDGLGIDPFVNIAAQLDDEVVRDLFEVRSPRPANWRLYGLDEFDGQTWTSSDPDASESGQVLSPPAVLPQAGPVPSNAETFSHTVRTLTDLPTGQGLPMAQVPVEINGALDRFTWDAVRGHALVEGGVEAGLEYTVLSRSVAPTPGDLDAVIPLTPQQYGRLTYVPEALLATVRPIADEWAAGETTAYRKVLAIQTHLRTEFTYDRGVEPNGSTDVLVSFLTETKRGFCVQFAAAMAVLVRSLGLPARVASGYQSGDLQANGSYLVQTDDAHAWVEVRFERYGWLTFEPTPGRGTDPSTLPGTYLNPADRQETQPARPDAVSAGGGPDTVSGTICPVTGVAGGPLSPQLCHSERRRVAGPGGSLDSFVPPEPAPVEEEPGYTVPYRLILLGLLAALGVLLIVVPIAKSVWRRARLQRAREPRDHVLAAYRVFDGEAADLGLGRREGETLEEHRARLSASIAFSDGHLGLLTSAAVRAAYSPSGPSPDEAQASVKDARRAIHDLRRQVGILRRIVGAYRPGV